MGDILDAAQTEARGEDEGCDCHASSNCDRQFGRDRETNGRKSIDADSENWTGRNRNRRRSPTTGGMLRQLIEEEEEQLAEIDEDTKRLRGEIERLQRKRERSESRRDSYAEMLRELEQVIKENP